MINRKVVNRYTPAEGRGFLGAGHTARAIIQVPFAQRDPFVLLMDDVLDKKDEEPAGGPHPHAGFETVSLLLQGEIGDHRHTLKAGDMQLMTAGRGVVHSEVIEKKSKMRLLQLWLNLPKKYRWISPRVQDIAAERVPVLKRAGMYAKVYSGALEGVSSPVENYTPFILADIHLEAFTFTTLTLPTHYSTFIYVLEGSVKVGENRQLLGQHQVGWLDRFAEQSESRLLLHTESVSSRFVLYAGQPQHDQIIQHGPFIVDHKEDIPPLFRKYRTGQLPHIAEVDAVNILRY